MYEITVEEGFRAGHQVRMYDGRLEDRHEHDWRVEVTLAAEQLDPIGVVYDFLTLRPMLKEAIAPLGVPRLNDVPALAGQNPTAEHVARYVFGEMAARLGPDAGLVSVRVWEAAGASAVYRPTPSP